MGSPGSTFLALGRWLWTRGLIDCTPEMFARARIAAEARAYANAHGECRLDAIYAELRVGLGLNVQTAKRLMQAELEVEAALLREVPGALDRVDAARAAGQRIVFASDMYLPPAFIREQLAHAGFWREGDGCYVSCEDNLSKSSGTLFSHILDQEHAAPRQLIHYGNSLAHDVTTPRRIGMQVDHFRAGNLNSFETLLERHTWSTDGLASAMAGAARLARLATPAANARESVLGEVAAGVVAPTLAGFVLWIMRRAQQLGLRRLYFLARDGQILMSVARPLAARLGIACELRYLFASRQSWNLASLIRPTPEQLEWIWDTTDFLSITSLLARVALLPSEVSQPLKIAGFGRDDWERPLSLPERSALRGVMEAPEVLERVADRAREKRRVLLSYLAQEGVVSSEPWGLVDLGWYGSLQNALSRLVASVGGSPPNGFYFALLNGAIADACGARREAYYFDERTRSGYLRAVPDVIPLMEMFCAADHGTVVDFVERDGRVDPILKEAGNEPVIDWGLPVVRQAITSFTEHLLVDAAYVNPWADVRSATTDVLRSFWVNPSRAVAEVWGSFPWEDGLGQETYRNNVGRAYGWGDVVRAVVRWRVEPHHRAYWPAGSLVLSPRGVRFLLMRIAQLRRAWRTR